MTVINGKSLLLCSPIKHMRDRKVHEHGVSWGLGEAGYDIRIKQDIRFMHAGTAGPCTWVDGEPHWGRFTIASAIEEFDMPDNLMAIVHDKSTWARQGLSVFNTVIEPGWKGFLTLELVFHGSRELHIPAGAGIAQIVFHRLTDLAQYRGKYQGQDNRPVEAIR